VTALLQQYSGQIEGYFHAGGMVMMPLLAVSVVMWTLIVNRSLFFRQLHRRNMPREKAGEYVRTVTRPSPARYRGITALFVNEFLRRRSGDSEQDLFILDETVLAVSKILDRHLTAIGVLARIAPLLGLLGTLTGMVVTFDIIAHFGTGNPKAMAGGISEALISTQTGLLVAIPGLYMWSFLNRRSENLKHRIASLGIYLKRFI
jgi:biopolymer transport protein ExbB